MVFIGGVSASDENDTQVLSQNVDEVVIHENINEISTIEVNSSGNDEVFEDIDASYENNLTSTNFVSSQNIEILGVSGDESILSQIKEFSGTRTSQLETEIYNANDGDVINLKNDIVTDLTYSPISISKSISINGNGHIIDLNNLGSTYFGGTTTTLFSIYANNVCLNNITFINGGTTIDVDHYGDYGPYYIGAPIVWNARNGTLSNCNFINNTASKVHESYDYDGNYDEYTYFITCCIEFNYGNSWIINCSFINNTGLDYNPCINIFADEKVSILNSTFENNSASELISSRYDDSSVFISNCNFTDNEGSFIEGIVNITKSNFINNTGPMGLISSRGYNNISECNFINNTGDGVISLHGWNNNISNCVFINNSAYYAGGAINYSVYGNQSIHNCTFINNRAGSAGGAVALNGPNNNVSNCIFVNNSAASGGAVCWFGLNNSISNCNFTNNSVGKTHNPRYTDYAGAAVESCGSGIISNCNFNNNFGKDAAVYSSSKGIIISESDFYNNTGAIQANGNSLIENCTFVNNSAGVYRYYPTTNYGSVYVRNSNNTIINSNFDDKNDNEIVVGGELKLNNNNVNGFILNKGTIVSPTSVVVLNNTTITIEQYTKVNLTAVVKDSDNNTIVSDDMYFVLSDGEKIPAEYNSEGVYYNEYAFNNKGDYTVSLSSDSLSDVSISTSRVIVEKTIGDFDLLQQIINNASENSIINLTHNFTTHHAPIV